MADSKLQTRYAVLNTIQSDRNKPSLTVSDNLNRNNSCRCNFKLFFL